LSRGHTPVIFEDKKRGNRPWHHAKSRNPESDLLRIGGDSRPKVATDQYADDPNAIPRVEPLLWTAV